MRPLPILLVLGALVLGLSAVARSEGEGTDRDPAVVALEAKIEGLQKQASYLLGREADLTRYVLANKERAAALEEMVRRARTQGFESRAIPAESRETLLAGIESLALDMAKGLPEVTKEQKALLAAGLLAR